MSIKNIIKKENKFGKEYLAVVVSNNDPLKRGRLQVKVDAILGDIPFWVNSTLVAGSTKLLLIPEVNDTVKIKFKNNDIYSGEWSLESNPNNESNIDPNKYGLQDAHGNEIIIDKQLGKISIVAANGNNKTDIIINKAGTVTIDGNVTINGTLHVTGAVTMASTLGVTSSITSGAGSTFNGINFDSHKHKYQRTSGGTSINTTVPNN